MRYSLARFDYSAAEPWQRDLFEQTLADLGFDSFVEDEAYIPTSLLNEQALRAAVEAERGIRLLAIEPCPDQNWNATWEEEHQAMQLPMDVTIIPHCAFGAGYHETTRMIINTLLSSNIRNKKVLDNGCGTGVLGIMAAKLGAESVVAVDIDDNSVKNTIENAALNHVSLDVRLGDMPPQGEYDLILSNIHRNILLQQMATYAQLLNRDGEVWMSGFYQQDVEPLLLEAKKHGLTLQEHISDGDWQMIRLKK